MVLDASDILNLIREEIPSIFSQVQVSVANHRKNCVALHKIHLRAAKIHSSKKKGSVMKTIGEQCFQDVFLDMVNRVLVTKNGNTASDRVVKFIVSYVKFLNERSNFIARHEENLPTHLRMLGSGCAAYALIVIPPSDAELVESSSRDVDVEPLSDDQTKISEHNSSLQESKHRGPTTSSTSQKPGTSEKEEDTPASRFINRILSWLLRGFSAKDKNVRFRSISIVAELISHLGEIDEDIYFALRSNLVDRVTDKESIIRMHAVGGLSKLAASEDPLELQDGERSIVDILLYSLQYDPAAEVRRAALLHTPFSPYTLSALLARSRDVDAVTRKLLYSSVLVQTLTHPRQLTLTQREQVVKDGLGDREDAVRVAAGKVLRAWFDILRMERGDIEGLVEFLKLFDIGGVGSKIGCDALRSLFLTTPDAMDNIVFGDTFWKNLTPESALLSRIFIEDCIESKNQARLELASVPVVTAFAFHIQEVYNLLLNIRQEYEEAKLLLDGGDEVDFEEEQERREDEMAEKEFLLSEMLRIAVKLDYGDEIGRRKIFTIVRDMLAHRELPENLIQECVDVLKEILPSERELIRVIVELMIDLRDEFDENRYDETPMLDGESQFDTTQTTIQRERSMRRAKQPHDMTPEEKLRADLTDVRCLTICISTLERINSSFEENSMLEGILGDLIIPAVKRKELIMREKGLVCLGLCCLIAKNMAMNSFQLFLSQVQTAPEELKVKVLQVIFDMLMVYDAEFFGRSVDVAERIITFLLQVLELEESPSVQAILCIGISKLMLRGLVTDKRILTSLVLAYVSPVTAGNQELRQCLSYFLPVYCYSSAENQTRMQVIFMTVFDLVVHVHEQLEPEQNMITPLQFARLVVDWTNPLKRAKSDVDAISTQDVHLHLAIDIFKALYEPERDDENKKILSQLLGQLYFPDTPEAKSLLILAILVTHLQEHHISEEPSLERSFKRFKDSFSKRFSKQVDRIDERKYAREDVFLELYELVGVARPEMDATSELESSPGRPLSAGTRQHAQKKASTQQEGSSSSTSRSEDEVSVGSSQVLSADEGPSRSPSSLPRQSKGKDKANMALGFQDLDPYVKTNHASPKDASSVVNLSTESDVEDKENNAVFKPATPKGRNNATLMKRLRSPTQYTPSPATRKRRRARSPGNQIHEDNLNTNNVTRTDLRKSRGVHKNVDSDSMQLDDSDSGIASESGYSEKHSGHEVENWDKGISKLDLDSHGEIPY